MREFAVLLVREQYLDFGPTLLPRSWRKIMV